MKKYALIINEETKEVSVGTGTNTKFYQLIGMVEMEVEQGYNGQWYLLGFAPIKPEITYEDVQVIRAECYRKDVDPITSQIQRLRDEDPSEEIIAEIEALKIKRADMVAKIRAENPYPD